MMPDYKNITRLSPSQTAFHLTCEPKEEKHLLLYSRLQPRPLVFQAIKKINEIKKEVSV